MKPFEIFLFLFHLLSLKLSQADVFGIRQPYFRGVLSSLSIVNSSGEFQPTLEDASFRPVVTIRDGTLRGFILRTVNGRAISAFQSIPFAKPPLGPLRFRDPVKNEPWSDVRDALPRSPRCMQTDFVQVLRIRGQEDCLYLNVYCLQRETTSKIKDLPVMIFIHGGAFFYGSGGIYGPKYLLDRDIVLVTLNYRLGPFGFLSTGDDASPGNQGMKDQVLALKWVQQNIRAFGGDPNSVTIFGESAGGSSCGLHIVSPLSRGLFHRAISQSMFCYRATRYNASVTANRLGEFLGCPTDSTHKMVNCLRNTPAQQIASAQFSFYEWLLMPIFSFAPTVEHDHPGAFITKHPEEYYENGEAANVNWISGLNTHEWSWLTAAMINLPTHISDINSDWDKVGPTILALDGYSTDVNKDIARRAWNFYMGDKKLTWETRHDFSELFGDRFVTECALDMMHYHSKYTSKSVYAYHLSYQGQYSNAQQFAGKPEDWGVVHLDDLIYLLNNPDYYSSLKPGDPELAMSEIITRIWSDFATHDKPHVRVGNKTHDAWLPIKPTGRRFSSLRFLDLNLNPRMIGDPYVKRYNFWKWIFDST